jgi:hypothetical protein
MIRRSRRPHGENVENRTIAPRGDVCSEHIQVE